MKLTDIFEQKPERSHWNGKYKIPWDEPEFSRRMLKEHLSQSHDLASRRLKSIDDHVHWIHKEVLEGKPSRILDLGCGPGLYSSRLAVTGHYCMGVDFSPASIEYAKSNNPNNKLCDYRLGDIRKETYGDGYDLVLFLYGEFNAFPRHEVEGILRKIYQSLNNGGQILIEAHTYEAVKRIGESENSWYKAGSGLFSNKPHICMTENSWDESAHSERQTFFVIDAATSSMECYTNTLQAYKCEEYRGIIGSAGFTETQILPGWGADEIKPDDSLLLIGATKM
jgi:SAM-dependent methyltransferase